MISAPAARWHRLAVLASVVTITVLGLTACVGTPKASPSGSTTGAGESASPSASPASAAPTPSATAGTPAQAVTIACGTLVPAQTMYNFNPNFGLDSNYRPADGSAAATAVAGKGFACNWTNQTSGDTVTIAVARPGSDALATLKADAAAGDPVSGLGESAYFASSGGTGRLDVFTGAYWLVATSAFFSTGADAKDLASAALSHLK